MLYFVAGRPGVQSIIPKVSSLEEPLCYTCDICYSSFYNLVIYITHINSHKDSFEPLVTPLPGTPMRSPPPQNQQSGQSMLQCEVCYVMFKNVKTLNTHVKQEHTDQKFVLNKKVTSAGVQVDGHDANVSIENESTNSSQSNVTPQKNCATYVCNVCKITVDTFIELQSHQKKDHPIHPYMCDINTCGSMYKTRGGLKKHLVKHDIASPIKCNTCQVIFSSAEKKTEHKCLQSEINKFHCDFVCGYTTNKTYDK